MKPKLIMPLFGVLVYAILLAGCSKTGGHPPQALEAQQIPSAVNQAFGKAAEDTRQAATNYVAVLQAQDTPAAFVELQKLSARNDLNPQQREVVARATLTMFKQLQTAAQNGNPAAKAAVHQYLSTR